LLDFITNFSILSKLDTSLDLMLRENEPLENLKTFFRFLMFSTIKYIGKVHRHEIVSEICCYTIYLPLARNNLEQGVSRYDIQPINFNKC